MIERHNPRYLWISTPCGPYSIVQNGNEVKAEKLLKVKRRWARKIVENALVLATAQIHAGRLFCWEWPRSNLAWDLPCMTKFLRDFKEVLHLAHLDGCAVGLRSARTGKLHLKQWRIMTNCDKMAKVLELRCQGNHEHEPIVGADTPRSAFYPKPMVRKIATVILDKQTWSDTVRLMKECDSLTIGMVNVRRVIKDYEDKTKRLKTKRLPRLNQRDETENPTTTDETMETGDETTDIDKLKPEERQRLETQITKLHAASGHPPNHVLISALRRSGAQPVVLKLAQKFECSACLEMKCPKSKATVKFNRVSEKWKHIGVDFKEYYHKQT